MKNIGIGILVIGLAITIFTSFSFFTKEKVVDIGSLEISREKEHNYTWSPFAGMAVMAIGGGMIAFSRRK